MNVDGGMLLRGTLLMRLSQGTNKRTQHQLEKEIENMGGHLNAYTSVRKPLGILYGRCWID